MYFRIQENKKCANHTYGHHFFCRQTLLFFIFLLLEDKRLEQVFFFTEFYSQLNTSGREPTTSDIPVSHSIDIPTEELKVLWSLEPHSFLPQYPLRLASTSTKQPTSYTHTWTDTPIMKYQRRNSATRGQSSHNVYTRALNKILFTT